MTAEAQQLARAATLSGGLHHQAWSALHEATNPDALGAAIQAVERARRVFGPDAAEFIDRARRRISG